MAKRDRYKRKADSNEQAARLVEGVTGTPAPDGESLLGDPDLQRQFEDAKKCLAVTRSRNPLGKKPVE